jgi:hypothetical protein
MEREDTFIAFSLKQAGLALIGVVGRTGVHLSPVVLRQRIAAKARAHLKSLEAFMRRLLLLMALRIEHEITPDMSEATARSNAPKMARQNASFSLFESQRASAPPPDFSNFAYGFSRPILAAPIIARIKNLQAILEAPNAYARRMAFRLARQREDQHTVLPGIGQSLRALGTEISALFNALAEPVFNACLARPARVGPRPRPPPRIRQL